jgi:hypothetical protein
MEISPMNKNLSIEDNLVNEMSFFSDQHVNPYRSHSKKNKGGRASEHMVPFFMKILDSKESNLTNAISQCIIDLDNLAINIDSQIDAPGSQLINGAAIDRFDNLESKIVDCFHPLSHIPEFRDLIIETINCVNISFRFNTTQRHLLYNFDSDIYFGGCTTYYLFPLVKYLSSLTSRVIDIDNIFLLAANYIQLLDDFIDVFDDIDLKISTPVTAKFIENIQNQTVFSDQSAFEILIVDVKKRLDDYLKILDMEIYKIRDQKSSAPLFFELHRFHSELAMITLKKGNDRIIMKQYLQEVFEIIPPIVCYTGS